MKDSAGTPLLHFRTEVLLQRQECTRDDDWSLHLMHIHVLKGGVRLKLLVERTGEDALRCNCSKTGRQPRSWPCLLHLPAGIVLSLRLPPVQAASPAFSTRC